MLSDPGNAYSRSLGLVHGFPDDLKEVYTSFNLVLPNFNGDDSWELPIPARMVIDSSGTIRDLQADPDYKTRPEPEATIEVLRGL